MLTLPRNQNFLGEINQDGTILDSKDEVVGYVDLGKATLRDSVNSHFATLVKSGEVLDRNECQKGSIKNFTFHHLKVVAAYFFLVDKTFFQEESVVSQPTKSNGSKSTESIDSTSLQGSGQDTTSVDKEELRLLKYINRGSKAKVTAPTTTKTPTAPNTIKTPPTTTTKTTTAKTTTAKTTTTVKPVEKTTPQTTSNVSQTNVEKTTSQVSPRSVVETSSTDDMGLIGDSDEKARKEEERMKKMMGFTPSGSNTGPSTKTGSSTIKTNDSKEYPIPTTPQIGTVYEASLWSELNRARNEPKEFAKYLIEMKPRFQGNKYEVPNKSNVFKQTTEGVDAVEEAIKFLLNASPLKALRLSTGLSKSSQDFVRLIGNAKNFDGIETNEQATERLSRYGRWTGKLLQNVALGDLSPTETVASWIIDDGNKNRDHRNSIFSNDIEFAGVASGPHNQFSRCIVVSVAGDYKEGSQQSEQTAEKLDENVPTVSEETKYVVGKIEPHNGYYSLSISNLGCPIAGLNLELLKNGTELYFVRKIRVKSTQKESAERWKLPFSVSTSNISAVYDQSKNSLEIIMKTGTSETPQEFQAANFKVSADPNASNESVDIIASTQPDSFIFTCALSKHDTQVIATIKGTSLNFNMEYLYEKDDNGRTVKVTKKVDNTFSLPFAPQPDQVLVTPNPGKGQQIKIMKHNNPNPYQPDHVVSISSK